MPVASAGLYEMPSSVASAGYLARNATGRDRFLVSRGLHPHAREALATYAAGFGAEIDEIPLAGGATDLAALEAAVDERVAAVFLQQPNFLGTVEDLAALAPAAKRAGGLLVTTVDAPTLGILRPPGEFGADVALGEGQPLGNRLDYGGPVVRLLRRARGAHPPHAGPHRGRDHRRRRPARLRAHAADARAAHPAREGDVEHLHQPAAERARGRDLHELARAAAGSSSWAS